MCLLLCATCATCRPVDVSPFYFNDDVVIIWDDEPIDAFSDDYYSDDGYWSSIYGASWYAEEYYDHSNASVVRVPE